MDVLALLDPSATPTPTLIAIAAVLVAVSACGVVYALKRKPRRSLDEMADPAFNPALDCSEARLRAALHADDDTDGLIVPPPGWWRR